MQPAIRGPVDQIESDPLAQGNGLFIRRIHHGVNRLKTTVDEWKFKCLPDHREGQAFLLLHDNADCARAADETVPSVRNAHMVLAGSGVAILIRDEQNPPQIFTARNTKPSRHEIDDRVGVGVFDHKTPPGSNM